MTLYPVTAFLTTVSALGIGAFTVAKNPRAAVNQRWGVMSLSVALWSAFLGVMFLSRSPEVGLLSSRLFQLGANFIPITFFHFILALLTIERRKKIWLVVGYSVTALMVFLGFTPLFVQDVVFNPLVRCYYPIAGPAYFLYVLVFFLYPGYAWLLMAGSLRGAVGLKRNQIKYVMVASTIGFLGGSSTFPLWYGISIPPLGAHFVFLYTTIISIAIIRYRLMDIRLAITRTAIFMLVYALVLGVPLLTALAWQPFLERVLGVRWWVWLLVTYAVLATTAHYTNLHFQRRAEARLLHVQRQYQSTLMNAAKGMVQVRELDRLLNIIVHLLTRAMKLTHAGIFLLDRKTGHYVLLASRDRDVLTPGLVLKAEDALVRWFREHRAPIVYEEVKESVAVRSHDQRVLVDVEASLRATETAVAIPSFSEETLLGFLVLGDKKTGHIYSQDDLNVLQTLANQAAIAIENARFYEEEHERQAALFHTASLASLGTMASSMSHQVNNRFNVVSVISDSRKASLTKLLDDPQATPAQLRAALQDALRQFTSLGEEAIKGGQIVSAIRKIGQPSRDGYHPVALSDALTVGLDVLRFKLRLESLDFLRNFPETLPRINGDLAQLGECFLNLIDNAHDAIQEKIDQRSPPDYRGRIHVVARQAVEDGASWVVVEVVDNGMGMDEKTKEGLFVPFFTTKATAAKGTGLGLYIIKKIIEAHSGTIAVTSTLGQGTVFTIRLPALQDRLAVSSD